MRFTRVRFDAGPLVAGVQHSPSVVAEGDLSLESCDLGVIVTAPWPGKTTRQQVLVPWVRVQQADIDPVAVPDASKYALETVEAHAHAELEIDPVGAAAMERAGNGDLLDSSSFQPGETIEIPLDTQDGREVASAILGFAPPGPGPAGGMTVTGISHAEKPKPKGKRGKR